MGESSYPKPIPGVAVSSAPTSGAVPASQPASTVRQKAPLVRIDLDAISVADYTSAFLNASIRLVVAALIVGMVLGVIVLGFRILAGLAA